MIEVQVLDDALSSESKLRNFLPQFAHTLHPYIGLIRLAGPERSEAVLHPGKAPLYTEYDWYAFIGPQGLAAQYALYPDGQKAACHLLEEQAAVENLLLGG
jgi:hypothetical protein